MPLLPALFFLTTLWPCWPLFCSLNTPACSYLGPASILSPLLGIPFHRLLSRHRILTRGHLLGEAFLGHLQWPFLNFYDCVTANCFLERISVIAFHAVEGTVSARPKPREGGGLRCLIHFGNSSSAPQCPAQSQLSGNTPQLTQEQRNKRERKES